MASVQQVDQDKVRAGETLSEAVWPWIAEQYPELTTPRSVVQYTGGASNWTYCLEYPQRSIILRRAPKGKKAAGAHNMGREFRLQKALKPVFPAVPTMLAFCDDSEIAGSDFYIMEKLDGLILRKNVLSNNPLSSSTCQAMCHSFIDCLVAIHQVDIQQPGLVELDKGYGYVDRQIEGWCRRYTDAKTWNVPKATKIINWLNQHRPNNEKHCLIHNDFRFDNLVLDEKNPTQIKGVLDWELATIGDPLMELGTIMAYWVQADDGFFAQQIRRQPSHLAGMLSRKQLLDYYCNKTGHEVGDFRFYQVYGLFRLAGIVQQIYYRYQKGQSHNKAFKSFWLMVHYLLWRANRVIEKGH